MGKRWGGRRKLSTRLRGEDIYIHNSDFVQNSGLPASLIDLHAKLFQLCPTLCDPMAPLSMGFSRQEYWSGVPFHSPGDLSDPGIKSESLLSPTLAGGFFTTSATWEARVYLLIQPFIQIIYSAHLYCGLNQCSVTYLLLHPSSTCRVD